MISVQKSIFTVFGRDNYPLSEELWRSARPLLDLVENAQKASDLEPLLDGQIENTVAGIRRVGPVLRNMCTADVREGGRRRDAATKISVKTTQHFVRLDVGGDIRLLEHWPDGGSAQLTPLDASSPETPIRFGSFQSELDKEAENIDGFASWTIGEASEGPPAKWSLYSYVFLTLQQERAVFDGALDINALFAQRRSALEPFVEQVAAQTDHFYSVELPSRLGVLAGLKREELAHRQAVTRSLTFPQTWKQSPPHLAEIHDEPPREEPNSTHRADGASAPAVLTIDARPRLSAASFDDVQRTIRVWADSVERYPKTFAGLGEDRLSDLLAATLNATLPGAEREVYTRKGKSDIFIHADSLAIGTGPAAVFILESKWARSYDVVKRALDPQLFGYMNAHDTAAVLMVLLPQQNRGAAVASYLVALREVAGYEGETASNVAGWPLLSFGHEQRTVQICVAFIHLPEQAPATEMRDEWNHVIEATNPTS